MPYDLNLALMKQGAKRLIGKHDFRSFCAVDSSTKDRDTVRTLKRFEVKKKGNLIRLVVEADGFLYHMVRNLAGALIELGRGKITLSDLDKILNRRDRKHACATAQPQGLFLMDVTY